MRKTKRRIRKHNYLGKAIIKNYSIKKGRLGRGQRSRSRSRRRSKISSNFLSWAALERVGADYDKIAAEAKAKQEAEWDAERKQGILGAMLGIHNAIKQAG